MKGDFASAFSVSRRAAALFYFTGSLLLTYGATGLQAQTTPTTVAPAVPPAATANSAIKQDIGLLMLPEDRPVRGMNWPALSPDGKTLCFVYLGDLWTVPAAGGVAIPLTEHEALDAYPHWSPDGKFIAFTSTRTGNSDIFLVPAQGGAARQVTYNATADWVTDWSPDGTKLLFYSVRDTHSFALFSIDLRTRAIKKLSNDEEALRYAAWSPDSKTIAYSRSGQPWWRAWYRGSVASSTVIEDLSTGKVRTLVKTNTQQLWPIYAPDGKSLYITMIYGSNNTPNLYRVPFDGGTPVAVTKYASDAVRYPSIARNGSRLCYLYNGDLFTARPDGSEAKKISIICRSDDKINNQERRVVSGASEVELAPDGRQLALVIQGNIWLVPTSGGDAKQLTNDPSTNDDMIWSPDGTKLAFISDRGNQPDLYTIDVKTKALTRLTSDRDAKSNTQWSPDGKWISFAKAGSQAGVYVVASTGGAPARLLAAGNGNNNFGQGITSHSWSPDSRWVAFARMDRYTTTDVWVVPAIGGTAINVTRYPNVNGVPKFTKDGHHLLFVSDRTGGGLFRIPLEKEDEAPVDDSAPKKKPEDRSKNVKIDFEDIQDRAKLVMGGGLVDYTPQPDGQRVVVSTGGGFISVGIKGGPATPLTASPELGGGIEFVPDGSRFYYMGANGTPRSLANQPGPPQSPQVVSFSAELLFDRRALIRQAFNEFYRKFGSDFYDAKMHGVDWAALRARYEPLLQGVGTPEEFANLLSEMVGEVNSSHSEISPASRPSGPQQATLGIFYDDSYTGPGLKVASVMSKGPADLPSTRLNPGDYILSIDGKDVAMNEDYYQTLHDKAGKVLDLLVNSKPAKEGARTLKLKAISTTDWTNLEYEAEVRHNRELVDKLSGGRLAYIHIRNMDGPSLAKFERELYSEALLKDGLVLDIRGNGGGNTHDKILEDLSRHVYGYTQPRDGLRQMQPVRAFTKSVVLLINQNSYSDAEIFPAGFRALKLGKVVGISTPGYVIGTYSGRLVDGTSYRLPMWGFYTADGKNMENLGIPPDVTVENKPEDVVAGKDRQLETAVQLLLKETPATGDKTAGSDNVTTVNSANLNPNGGSSEARPGGKGTINRVPAGQ